MTVIFNKSKKYLTQFPIDFVTQQQHHPTSPVPIQPLQQHNGTTPQPQSHYQSPLSPTSINLHSPTIVNAIIGLPSPILSSPVTQQQMISAEVPVVDKLLPHHQQRIFRSAIAATPTTAVLPNQFVELFIV